MEACAREVLKAELSKGGSREVWVRFPRQLGDVIFSLPFFGSLQDEWNVVARECGATLRWVAVGHAIGAALFSEADPSFIAESLIEGGGQAKPDPWHLLKRWKREKPVAVINLSQSVRLALAAWMARVPVRAGDVNNHLSFLYHHTFTYRDLPIHVAQRFAPLLEKLAGHGRVTWTPLSPAKLGGGKGMETLRQAGWRGEPYVTLAVGTRGFNKRWFPEEQKWPELAKRLQGRGYTPVWLGGPDECGLGGTLAAAVPGSLNLTGQTTLPEACAVQFGAAGNIAIDTGLAHTGAALGVPTVVLIGASPEQLINPIGPFVLSMRGPAVDLDDRPVDFETHGSDAHRIEPGRVLELLEVLIRERAGRA